jgi:hypothetical protein
MTKQLNSDDDQLFGSIQMPEFDMDLIDVDGPPDEGDSHVEKPGDKGKTTPADKEKPGDKVDKKENPQTPPKDNTFIVDDGKDEEIDDSESDKKDAKDKNIKDKDKKNGSIPTEGNESPVYLHAAALQESGVLPNFDLKSLDGLEPEEAILKINEHIQGQIDAEIKDGIDEYKSTIGEKALKFIESLESGVPFDDLADNYSLEERYGSISEKDLKDNVELQEQLYSDYLTLKGIPESKIKNYIAFAKEKETLLTDAVDGLAEIQTSIKEERKHIESETKIKKEKEEDNKKKTKEAIGKSVKELKEIFPGIPVSEDEKKEIVKMMTVPVIFTNKDGKKIPVSEAMALRAKNPIAFEARLAYFIKHGLFDENIKEGAFSNFTKKVETSAAKRLSQVLSGEEATKKKPVSEVDKEKRSKDKDDDFIFPQFTM